MRCAAFVFVALLATPAFAEEQPQATVAPASGPSVADQIADYLRTSPAAQIDDGGISGVTPSDDRKVHGEVAVGVGTGGYRSLYMRSDMPIGETGGLSIAIEDTRYGRGYGHGYAAGPGYGFGSSASLGASRDPRRCDLEGLTPPRPLDALGGPNGRCRGRPGP